MNTTDQTFIQQVGVALLEILVGGINTTIDFIFQLLSAVVSGILFQNGLGTGTLFGS